MIEMRLPIDVPLDRRVTLTLPANVPTGAAQLTVMIESVAESSPTVNLADTARAFPPRPLHPKLAAEFDAFQQLLPNLLTSHRGEYVAVHNGQVVEFGVDHGSVLNRAFRKTGDPMIYVERVTDQPQPIPRSGVVRETATGSTG